MILLKAWNVWQGLRTGRKSAKQQLEEISKVVQERLELKDIVFQIGERRTHALRWMRSE